MDHYYNQLRNRAIRKHGGKCAICGFSDWRALHFDHVKGRGREERRLAGRNHFLDDILLDTTGKYQLLCANCNNIKKYTNGEGVSRSGNRSILAAMENFQGREELVISFC